MLGALVLLVGLIGALASLGTDENRITAATSPSGSPSVTASETASAATTPSNPASKETAQEEPTSGMVLPEPAESSAPPPPPPAPDEPLVFKGSGNDVVKFDEPLTEPMIIRTQWKGPDANNTIYSLDASGADNDLLVNSIGSYSGSSLINKYEGTEVAALQVEGEGQWTVRIEPLSNADRWDGAETYEGKSDAVLLVPDVFTGLSTIEFTSTKAEGNVTVYGYGDTEDLIVNDIGNFEGEYVVPSGVSVLEVDSDGNWSMQKS